MNASQLKSNNINAHEAKRFKFSQEGDDNSSQNAGVNRERPNIEEIIKFIKNLNAVPGEVQNFPELSQPSASSQAQEVTSKRGKNPPVISIKHWDINEETTRLALEKMNNSQHLKIPIVIIIDYNHSLMMRKTSGKPIHLRPHVHEFIEFIMQNFYVINWTSTPAKLSHEGAKVVYGPYEDYLLCNLTKFHCQVKQKGPKKLNPTKDLKTIWTHYFQIDPASVAKTFPSPHVKEDFESNHVKDVKEIADPKAQNLYLGVNPRGSGSNSNARPLKFSRFNTILIEGVSTPDFMQPDNRILVSEYKGPIYNRTDNELANLKDYLNILATYYRAEFDKCEKNGTEFEFHIREYMKKNPYIAQTNQ